MANTTTLQQLKTGALQAQQEPDYEINLFSARGFALACRLANAFSQSDAVPAQFRAYNLKKVNGVEEWVENTSGTGNCIVAIEVAQAVGMSVTAVMQNADVIEGKLRWSAKFVIAAINSSRRFSPLRFDIQNLGKVKASYREKTGWDKQERKPIFESREIEIENLQCIAWALPAGVPFPAGVHSLAQAKAAGLPVIEGVPVSIKMAVEEGWYAKPGSKWQTELKHMMLQYRAGTFFGNIHAPDIVMGMGRTAEEERDTREIDITPPKEQPATLNLSDLRNPETTQPPQPEQQKAEAPVAPESAQPAAEENQQPAADTQAEPKPQPQPQPQPQPRNRAPRGELSLD